jgi:catechol 2,3-dioxygenase-like lactoylglutathione lyase family enzyme
MRVTGITANLPVADIATASEFYREYLGLSGGGNEPRLGGQVRLSGRTGLGTAPRRNAGQHRGLLTADVGPCPGISAAALLAVENRHLSRVVALARHRLLRDRTLDRGQIGARELDVERPERFR